MTAFHQHKLPFWFTWNCRLREKHIISSSAVKSLTSLRKTKSGFEEWQKVELQAQMQTHTVEINNVLQRLFCSPEFLGCIFLPLRVSFSAAGPISQSRHVPASQIFSKYTIYILVHYLYFHSLKIPTYQPSATARNVHIICIASFYVFSILIRVRMIKLCKNIVRATQISNIRKSILH